MSSSNIANNPNNNKTTDSPSSYGYFVLNAIIFFMIVILYFYFGGSLMYLCKLAQYDKIFPTDKTNIPYTIPTEFENIFNVSTDSNSSISSTNNLSTLYNYYLNTHNEKIMNNNLNKINPTTTNLPEDFKHFLDNIKFVTENTILQNTDSTLKMLHINEDDFIKKYLKTIFQSMFTTNYEYIILILKLMYKLPESAIVLCGPIIFVITLSFLYVFDIFYFMFSWFYNMTIFFENPITKTINSLTNNLLNSSTTNVYDVTNTGNTLINTATSTMFGWWYNIGIGIFWVIIFTIVFFILLGIPFILPLFIIAWCVITLSMYKGEINNCVVGIWSITKDSLKYHKFLIMIIISLYSIIACFTNLGIYVGIVSIIIVIIFYYKTDLFKSIPPNIDDYTDCPSNISVGEDNFEIKTNEIVGGSLDKNKNTRVSSNTSSKLNLNPTKRFKKNVSFENSVPIKEQYNNLNEDVKEGDIEDEYPIISQSAPLKKDNPLNESKETTKTLLNRNINEGSNDFEEQYSNIVPNKPLNDNTNEIELTKIRQKAGNNNLKKNISKLNRQKNVYNKLINYKNNNLTDNLKLINNYLTLLHT